MAKWLRLALVTRLPFNSQVTFGGGIDSALHDSCRVLFTMMPLTIGSACNKSGTAIISRKKNE